MEAGNGVINFREWLQQRFGMPSVYTCALSDVAGVVSQECRACSTSLFSRPAVTFCLFTGLFFFYFARQIASWLKKTFENQLVSQLEVNVEIVDLLHMFLEYSEERERNVSFLIEDMKQVAAEYDADGELKAPLVSFFSGFFLVILQTVKT